ncbi:hypothetical protein BaDB11_00127 [Bacillus licheniformis]|nr:hypothetical protein BaDB11_00127 [Bacillus licheniformis]ARC67907.1 hypothetical protein B34_00464 [Bacillus licheniformis]PZW85770.1 hypothetical protein DEU48_102362 [Bacillus sp. AG442]
MQQSDTGKNRSNNGYKMTGGKGNGHYQDSLHI